MTRTGALHLRPVATGVAVATAASGAIGASAHVAAKPASEPDALDTRMLSSPVTCEASDGTEAELAGAPP